MRSHSRFIFGRQSKSSMPYDITTLPNLTLTTTTTTLRETRIIWKHFCGQKLAGALVKVLSWDCKGPRFRTLQGIMCKIALFILALISTTHEYLPSLSPPWLLSFITRAPEMCFVFAEELRQNEQNKKRTKVPIEKIASLIGFLMFSLSLSLSLSFSLSLSSFLCYVFHNNG